MCYRYLLSVKAFLRLHNEVRSSLAQNTICASFFLASIYAHDTEGFYIPQRPATANVISGIHTTIETFRKAAGALDNTWGYVAGILSKRP